MNRMNPLDAMPIVQIEDDADDQLLIGQALEADSIPNPIRFFSNGQQVLTYLRTTTQQPLVILCDVKMPLMDGFELRDQIDANAYLKEKAIPFIFFSTWVDKELIDRAYQGTIQGYHRKRGDFDELKEELALIITYWKRCLHPNQFKP